MSLPAALEFAITALPGDYYLRLPITHFEGIVQCLRDDLVMVDGAEPALWPELEVLEPEETHAGLFPIAVRTVIALEPPLLAEWLSGAVTECAWDGRDRVGTDEEIAGVLYWGSENERWRLRRVCISRYSRIEQLEDTTELESYGAFRDWLLVQENQYQAWTLYRHGWSDYNTTQLPRLMPFLRQYLTVQEYLLSRIWPGRPVVAPVLEEASLERELAKRTAISAVGRARQGIRLVMQWELETGRLTRLDEQVVRV
jgi:hypothetical protein